MNLRCISSTDEKRLAFMPVFFLLKQENCDKDQQITLTYAGEELVDYSAKKAFQTRYRPWLSLPIPLSWSYFSHLRS